MIVLLIPFIALIKTVKIPELIFLLQKIIKFYCLIITFPVENGSSKQEKIGLALNKENCEEHPRSNLAQKEDYITQVFEEIKGRVTKRLSKEFSRTENRILGALARLDDFLMNPLLQGHSETTLEPSRNALSTRQGTNEDDSQNDLHPEAGLFHSQLTQNSDPEDGHDSKSSKS